MSKIEVSLDGIEAWGGESANFPPGPYSWKIKAATVEQTSKGKKQLELDNECVSGPLAGKTHKSWFMLEGDNDTWRKRLKSLITATRLQVQGGGFDSEALIGCQYDGDVQVEEYEGDLDMITQTRPKKTRSRIVNEQPLGTLVNKTNAMANAMGSAPTASVGGVPGMAGLTPA